MTDRRRASEIITGQSVYASCADSQVNRHGDFHLRKSSIILLLLLLIAGIFCQMAEADDLAGKTKRAEQGDSEAQYELGVLYSEGAGVRQDYGKAFSYFSAAAEKKNADAQYELACLYYGGMGVERDPQKAQSLFALSAENGSVEAQYFLARIYHKGRGVKKNHRKAIYWYRKAADQGNQEATAHLAELCTRKPSLCQAKE